MDPTHKYIHWGFRNNLIFYLQFFLWFAAQFQSLSKFIRNWKRIIDKTNQHRAEFGPLRPTERVASQPKKAWTAGCISEKFRVFFAKRIERGGRTTGRISLKFKDFFIKWPGLARSGPSVQPIGRPTCPLYYWSWWLVQPLINFAYPKLLLELLLCVL